MTFERKAQSKQLCKTSKNQLLAMNSFITVSIVAVAMALMVTSSSAGVIAAAPLAVPAAVGYAHTVPQNIPPFASRVDISSRIRAAPILAAAPAPILAAAPAPIVAAAPYAAAPALPYLAAPFLHH